MKVCVLHRPYRNSEWHTKMTGETFPDDAIEEARHHAEAIAATGHETEIVTWNKDMRKNIAKLESGGYDLVVNASSIQEVALLEILGIPFMGSGLDLVSLDKATRKRLWIESGVNTPKFVRINNLKELKTAKLPAFPLFVKPINGRGSQGITDESIVNTEQELYNACDMIISKLEQGALVEEYIQGTEVTVALIGNGENLKVLQPLEIEYTAAKTNSYWHKQDNEIFHCPARLDPSIVAQLKSAAKQAFLSLDARDFGRVDFIYDHQRCKPYALELNTFAGLQILSGEEQNLHSSYIGKMAETMGWDRSQLFSELMTAATSRYGL